MSLKKEQRAEKLRELLQRADIAYHGADAPIMPDHEYDALLAELRTLEKELGITTKNSPTKTVGAPASGRFAPFVHDKPMLSLGNAFSDNDLRAFDARVREIVGKTAYICEFKIDGLAVAIRYKNGLLVQAGTRGDGKFGEDVTNNIKTISDIPQKIARKGDIEIRGEVHMRKNVLAEINKELKKNNKEPLANVRNAAAGALRQLNPEITRARRLSFFPYTHIDEKFSFLHQSNALAEAIELGFPKPQLMALCMDIEKVIDVIRKWEDKRDDLAYEIDGIVIKVDKIKLHAKLGATSKDPRWGIAYKFKPRAAQTQLLDISITVGRTGVLTPNAVLKTVSIGGTRVSAATLHNAEYIEQKDIRIGDIVEVIRAGDVIPRVEHVVLSKRNGTERKWKMPKKCPACGSTPEQEGVAYYCQRPTCPAQIVERLSHFASRDAMDIDGFGDAVAQAWAPHLNDLSDIFTNTAKNLTKIGIEGKQHQNLLNAIEEAKTRGLGRLLFGLGIRNVGKKTAMDIAQKFKNLESLLAVTEEELLRIDGIGGTVAHSVSSFLNDKNNVRTLHNLEKAGLRMTEKGRAKNGTLDEKIFVITGTLPNLSRDEAASLIENAGGKISGAVSKKTTYLVAGESAGSKLDKAKSLGVKIIDEKQLRIMAAG